MTIQKTSALANLLLAALLVSGCSGEDDGIQGTGFDVSGAVQKGPFVIGSSVNINYLDAQGKPTTQTIPTKTTDNLGNFGFDLDTAQLVKIEAKGYHRNELTGALSKGELTLNAIFMADGSTTQKAYVNVLTHLIHQRVQQLIESGTEANQAISIAQSDFIVAFKSVLPVESLPRFSLLNVYDTDTSFSEGNAYLLALSSTLYQYATNKTKLDNNLDAELTFLLNTLAEEFKTNGKFTEELLGELVEASRLLRPDIIEENLKSLAFDVIKQRLPIPNINLYIDSDKDGLVNASDTDDDNDGIADALDTNPYIPDEIGAQLVPPQENSEQGSYSLKMSVTDEALVQKVEYLIDGELIGESKKAPFGLDWNTYYWADKNGKVNLSTRITDIGGNISFGPTAEITINTANNNAFTLIPASNTFIRDANKATLQWEGLTDAVKYKLQIWKSDAPDNLLVDTELSEASFEVTDLAAGEYSWRIMAANRFDNWGSWSDSQTFIVTGPLAPEIEESSTNLTIRDANTATLKWKPSELAANYDVTLSSDVDFNQIVVEKNLTQLELTTEALPAGDYYWRVRSQNSLLNAGEWSETGVFRITGPVAPEIVTPLKNASAPSGQDITFEWSPVAGASDYEFQLADNEAFENPEVSEASVTNSVEKNLLTGKKYWRVRASNSFGFKGDWSNPRVVNVGMFTKSFGGDGRDYARAIKQTSDGGYLVFGGTDTFGAYSGIYLLKINALGEEQWHSVFETGLDVDVKDVVELSDGNIIVAGSSNSKLWLIKVKASGEVIWNKIMTDEQGGKLLSLSDGYLVGSEKILSETISNETPEKNVVPKIVRFDLADSEVWSHTFDESTVDYENLFSIEKGLNDNFIIIASIDSTPEEKITNMWNYPIGYSLSSDASSSNYFVVENSSGGIFYTYTQSLPDNSTLVYISAYNGIWLKLFDSSGNIVWNRRIQLGFAVNYAVISQIITYDNIVEFYLSGTEYTSQSNGIPVNVVKRVKYTIDGDFMNSETIFANGSFFGVVSAADSGLVLLSHTEESQGNSEIVVIKADAKGNTVD